MSPFCKIRITAAHLLIKYCESVTGYKDLFSEYSKHSNSCYQCNWHLSLISVYSTKQTHLLHTCLEIICHRFYNIALEIKGHCIHDRVGKVSLDLYKLAPERRRYRNRDTET